MASVCISHQSILDLVRALTLKHPVNDITEVGRLSIQQGAVEGLQSCTHQGGAAPQHWCGAVLMEGMRALEAIGARSSHAS